MSVTSGDTDRDEVLEPRRVSGNRGSPFFEEGALDREEDLEPLSSPGWELASRESWLDREVVLGFDTGPDLEADVVARSELRGVDLELEVVFSLS